MGFDKLQIKINNRPLIEIICEQLEAIFQELIILRNSDDDMINLKYKVFKDIIPNLGPIGAIHSALKYASSENVFVTACDMPVINIEYIKYMMELMKHENIEGVVSCKEQYVEPLYAFYSKKMIKTIE